jgi:hypothetical protein
MPAAAFKLTPEIVPERDLQESCARVLEALLLPPAFWFSAAIGATKLSAQQAAALSRAGVKRGLPDLFVLYRGVFCVELKAIGGRMSRTREIRTARGSPRILVGQEDVFPALVASGGVKDIKIAHSVDEMLDHLTRWGIPLRSHRR